MNTHMKRYLAAAVVAMGLTAGSNVWALSTGFEDGTITVTPVANVSLDLDPTTYAFGEVDVQTSTVTGHALVLSNLSEIGVSITKQIPSNTGLWVADTSSVTANHYILYVATATTAPTSNGSQFTSAHQFGTAATNNALKGLVSSNNVSLTAAGGALTTSDLYFRLDMPMSVTATTPQEIGIRFTGTAL